MTKPSETGLRATLGVLMGDFFLEEPLPSQVERAETFIDAFHDTREGRIRASICPHGDAWGTDAIWEQTARLADAHPDMLVHTHLDEMPESRKLARYLGAEDPLSIPENHDLVDERFCAAHFRLAADSEAKRLARAGAAAVHCPTIIAYWSSGDDGWMPLRTLLDHDATVGLGLDDTYWHDSHDMFREAKTARIFANHHGGTPSVTSAELLRMLTSEGAREMGIGDHTGQLAQRACADVTVVDCDRAWMRPSTNLPARLVNTASNRDVRSVMVDGRFLMRDRRVQTLDETAVLEEAEAAVERFTEETNWELDRSTAEAPTVEALRYSPTGGMMQMMGRLGWQSVKEALGGGGPKGPQTVGALPAD